MKQNLIIVSKDWGRLLERLSGISRQSRMEQTEEDRRIEKSLITALLRWFWIPTLFLLAGIFIWFNVLFIAPTALVNASAKISILLKIICSLGLFYLSIFVLSVASRINYKINERKHSKKS